MRGRVRLECERVEIYCKQCIIDLCIHECQGGGYLIARDYTGLGILHDKLRPDFKVNMVFCAFQFITDSSSCE